MNDKKVPLSTIKRWAKKDARELYYKLVMPDVMERIDSAKTEGEVYRVLATAREML